MKKANFKWIVLWVLIASLLTIGIASAASVQFGTRLLGANEVPAVMTTAYGSIRMGHHVGSDGMNYKIDVHRISPVTAAHIHCAPVGVNGPVGVTLFSGGPVDVDGLLAAGTITAPDAGNGCGWVTLDDVVSAIQSGNAYVNVHTTTHPSGEIRGQLSAP